MSAIRKNGVWGVLDGNLTNTHARPGILKGVDEFGNQYYESAEKDGVYLCNRWVVYSKNYHYNASTVPPRWHGWLHFIHDTIPSEDSLPKYAVEHRENPTGRLEEIHLPKGSAYNPQRRQWGKAKVETWNPSG
eukprot:jgi/Mesvir1/11561/Mv17932-RA.1